MQVREEMKYTKPISPNVNHPNNCPSLEDITVSQGLTHPVSDLILKIKYRE